LRFIPADQVSAVWPQVRPFLLAAQDSGGINILPEELYYALRQNLAALYLCDAGIIVAQKITELDGSISCFVWLAAGSLSPHAEDCLRLLERLAKGIGAKRLRMRSPRRWDRALHGYWKPYETIYEHELTGAEDAAKSD